MLQKRNKNNLNPVILLMDIHLYNKVSNQKSLEYRNKNKK
jgi:hypothetical protein